MDYAIARNEAGLRTPLVAGGHALVADEPEAHGGTNQGPNPYDLLSAALAACTAMTLRLYAQHKRWPVETIEVRVRHEKVHREDCDQCDHDPRARIDRFERTIAVSGSLEPDQLDRLKEIAQRCPVHRTLTQGTLRIVDAIELVLPA